MICNKCFKYIKLKCFFYFSLFSSNNTICKKQDMTNIEQFQVAPLIKNWSMIDDGDDYGQFYDTENNQSLRQESREMKEFEYDDPYEEYLDRYEQYLNYEDRTLEKEYNAISRYEKLLKKKVLFYEHPLLYVVQYILGYRN